MKKIHLRVIASLLLTFLAAAAVSAQSPYLAENESAELAHLDRPNPPPAHARVGMSRAEVVHTLERQPDERLGPELWIYWNFAARNRRSGDQGNALLLYFTKDRVSRIRLTDAQPVRELLARQRAKSPAETLAAKR